MPALLIFVALAGLAGPLDFQDPRDDGIREPKESARRASAPRIKTGAQRMDGLCGFTGAVTVEADKRHGSVPVVHIFGHAIEDPINAEAVKSALAPVAVLLDFHPKDRTVGGLALGVRQNRALTVA